MTIKTFETKGARFERKSDDGQQSNTQEQVKQILAEFKTVGASISEFRQKSEAELKAAGEVAAETKAKLEEAEKKQGELVANFKTIEAKLIEMQLEQKQSYAGAPQQKRSTLGGEFVKSDAYKNHNGRTVGEVEIKDVSSLAASAGALVRTDRDPEVYRSIGGKRPLRIRDLIPSIPTSSNSVEIMRQTAGTGNAAPQGTTAGIGGGEFVAKKQSNLTWELVTVPIRTIAHWVPASRQVLDDAPMLQGLIDSELEYGLQLESDAQLLVGDGTGQNMTGIMNDTAINDIGKLASGTAAADVPAAMIDHIRSAKTQLQINEYYNANGLVMNPVDFETLETAKATDGHYILVSNAATSATATEIWRIPVVISNAMTQGSFLLGDWSIGAKVYDRETVSIRVSESHADYFVKNAVAILGEERYTLAVNRPLEFCKGSFAVASLL